MSNNSRPKSTIPSTRPGYRSLTGHLFQYQLWTGINLCWDPLLVTWGSELVVSSSGCNMIIHVGELSCSYCSSVGRCGCCTSCSMFHEMGNNWCWGCMGSGCPAGTHLCSLLLTQLTDHQAILHPALAVVCYWHNSPNTRLYLDNSYFKDSTQCII